MEMTKPKKKRVGRPRKQERLRIGRRGILTEPDVAENVVEVAYDLPSIFESIFFSAKRISDGKMEMIFEPEEFIFIARDKDKKKQMVMQFNPKNMKSYYCKESYAFECKPDLVAGFIKTRKRTDNYISFTISIANLNEMKILLKEDKDKKKNSCEDHWPCPLEKIAKPSIADLVEIYDHSKTYPLSFKLDWAGFKSKATAWKKRNPQDIYIEKEVGDDPLKFHYEYLRNQCSTLYPAEDINLVFNSDTLFSTRIALCNLLPISQSEGLSRMLQFRLCEVGDMVCEAFIDEELNEDQTSKEGTELAIVKFFTKLQ